MLSHCEGLRIIRHPKLPKLSEVIEQVLSSNLYRRGTSRTSPASNMTHPFEQNEKVFNIAK